MEQARERLRSVTVAIAAADCKNVGQEDGHDEVDGVTGFAKYMERLHEERRSLTMDILAGLGLQWNRANSTSPPPASTFPSPPARLHCGPLTEFSGINGRVPPVHVHSMKREDDGEVTKGWWTRGRPGSPDEAADPNSARTGIAERGWERVPRQEGKISLPLPFPSLGGTTGEGAEAPGSLALSVKTLLDGPERSTTQSRPPASPAACSVGSLALMKSGASHTPDVESSSQARILRPEARKDWNGYSAGSEQTRPGSKSSTDGPDSVSPPSCASGFERRSVGMEIAGRGGGSRSNVVFKEDQGGGWTGGRQRVVAAKVGGTVLSAANGGFKLGGVFANSSENSQRVKCPEQKQRKHLKQTETDDGVKGCKEMGCRRRPLYAFQIGRRAIRCPLHKMEGMVNVRHPLCQNESCFRQPSFGMEGDQRASFCSEHRLPHMVNVSSRRCLGPGCLRHPNFGFPGERRASYCRGHKAPGMIDVVSRRCQHPECSRRPLYAMSGQRASFCSAHKDVGMIDVVSSRCQYEEGCNRHPSFGWKNADGKARRCAHHRLEGMESVKVHRRNAAKAQ